MAGAAGGGLGTDPRHASHVDADRRQDPARAGADGQPLVAGDALRDPPRPDDVVDPGRRPAASRSSSTSSTTCCDRAPATAARARSRWSRRSVAEFYAETIARARRARDRGARSWPSPTRSTGRSRSPRTPTRLLRPRGRAAVLAAAGAGAPGDERVPARFVGKVQPGALLLGRASTWPAPGSRVARAPRHPGGAPNCADWVMVEGYSHELSSCGFWPGGGEEGAFYAYAYPEPDGVRRLPRRSRSPRSTAPTASSSCCPTRRCAPPPIPTGP